MEPTIEQWQALYDEAIKIKRQKPWQWMNSGQLFAIEDPVTKINYYCSIQSEDDTDFIQMFIGEKGLNRMLNLADKLELDELDEMDMPLTLASYMSHFDEESLKCFFINKEALSLYERRNMERLGLNFRGSKQWIALKEQRPGFAPEAIHTSENVRIMTLLLAQIYKVCNLEKKAPFIGDFFQDNILTEIFWWRYDSDKKRWRSDLLKTDAVLSSFPITIYENQFELHKTRKLRTSQNVYELLRIYLPIPVEHLGKMCYPCAYILLDLDTGMISWNHMDVYEDGSEQKFLGQVCQFFQSEGRKPSKIVTADIVAYHLIVDFCEKAKIFVEYLDYTLMGDDVIESFIEFTRKQILSDVLKDKHHITEGDLPFEQMIDELSFEPPYEEEPPKPAKKQSKIIDFKTGKPL